MNYFSENSNFSTVPLAFKQATYFTCDYILKLVPTKCADSSNNTKLQLLSTLPRVSSTGQRCSH